MVFLLELKPWSILRLLLTAVMNQPFLFFRLPHPAVVKERPTLGLVLDQGLLQQPLQRLHAGSRDGEL